MSKPFQPMILIYKRGKLYWICTSVYRTLLYPLRIPVRNFIHLLPVPLVDEMPPGEQVCLQVSVQHELHHSVHWLITGTHSQQFYYILEIINRLNHI